MKKSDNIFAVGRRKASIARVRLIKGKGENLVNDRPVGKYFPGASAEVSFLSPFKLTETLGKFYATIRVRGGGLSGQLAATIHGLARALILADSEKFRPILKKEGFLTRDARVKERRKFGLAQKARAKKQSPKR
ncbi:30S ribosomal protein S9 [Candidatus Shapirobacteria bacterium]|nr:30S ribosomal protein S9 [Candidatus Shapirobacteria bacterium]